MNTSNFDMVVQQRLATTRSVLQSKATEYAAPTDRLFNFKRGAEILGVTPAFCLLGYLTKHITSVYDMATQGVEKYTEEQWDEKIGDAINYLILLEAIVSETHGLLRAKQVLAETTTVHE
jgi:hypothetical protein